MRDVDELGVEAWLRIGRKWLRFFLLVVIGAGIVAALVSLILPKYYRAEAMLLPLPNSQQSVHSIGGVDLDMLDLGDVMGNSKKGYRSVDVLLAIFRSRTIAERVIETENLVEVLLPGRTSGPLLEDAVRTLKKQVAVDRQRREPVIRLSGTFTDPQLAARIVLAFIRETDHFIRNSVLTESKAKRLFIGEQLKALKQRILESGRDLSVFPQKYQISSTKGVMDVPTDIDFGTISKGGNPAPSDRLIHNIPHKVYLEYLGQELEVLNRANLMMVDQYFMAQIDEAREEPLFQVIDPPIAPAHRYSPQRTLIVLSTMLVVAILTCVSILFIERSRDRNRPGLA